MRDPTGPATHVRRYRVELRGDLAAMGGQTDEVRFRRFDPSGTHLSSASPIGLARLSRSN